MLIVFQWFPALYMYAETAVAWHNFCIDFISGITVLDDWHAGICTWYICIKLCLLFSLINKRNKKIILW